MPAKHRPRLAQALTLAAMSLGYGVVQLDVTIVNTALSAIGNSLGGGVSELQWVVSAYTIAFAALILTAGAPGDRLGAKRVFMAGFALFTAGSFACTLAPNAAILIAARAVQGLGAAILVPNSLALLNHAYPDEKDRGRAIGMWAAGASLALTAGPLTVPNGCFHYCHPGRSDILGRRWAIPLWQSMQVFSPVNKNFSCAAAARGFCLLKSIDCVL